MDHTPPLLTDPDILACHRMRARRQGTDLFLHADAARELQERLSEVNRTFTAPALIAPFPEVFTPVLPGAKVVAESELLNLEEGAHDLVVHAFALHWANDPVGQLVQCLRALRPDGLFLAVFPAGRTLAELRDVLTRAEIAQTGGLSPRVLPMGEIRELGALLQRAGFALPVADTVLREVRYRDPMRLFRDLRAMGETNALHGRIRHFTRRGVIFEALEHYITEYGDEEGCIPARFEMVWLTGWRPAPGQQKPARPGSAQMRLADALGTTELASGEKPG